MIDFGFFSGIADHDNLFAVIWPSPDEKDPSIVKLSRAGRFRWGASGSLPEWTLCRGISGSFRVEWVAGFVWNQWQPCSVIRSALQFVDKHASDYAGGVNLLVAPCVSPWSYERIHRWNLNAVDPNRSFCDGGSAEESVEQISHIASAP